MPEGDDERCRSRRICPLVDAFVYLAKQRLVMSGTRTAFVKISAHSERFALFRHSHPPSIRLLNVPRRPLVRPVIPFVSR